MSTQTLSDGSRGKEKVMQVVDPEGAYEYREVTDDLCGYFNSIEDPRASHPCTNELTYWVSEKDGNGDEFGACNLHAMNVVESSIGPNRVVVLRPAVKQ